MNILSKGDIPQDILADSALARLVAAYLSIGKRMERKTGCSATRGFILHALRDGGPCNQNQVATLLGFDRTVVHRAIKSMVKEGLVSERKAISGRAIHLKLTAKGHRYRERLIEARRAVDDALRDHISQEEQRTFVRFLKLVAELEF